MVEVVVPEFCPRCGSGNFDEDEVFYGYWHCNDCDYKWRINNSGEAEPATENLADLYDDNSTEENSKEDSESDGLIMGDSMFPPEDFDGE